MEISNLAIADLLQVYENKEFLTDYDTIKFLSNINVKNYLSKIIEDKYDLLLNNFSKECYNLRMQVYYLSYLLCQLYLEKENLLREIKKDEAILEDNNVTWKESEKTEWRHDLASKKTISMEDINQKINSIEDSIRISVGIENARRNK